MQVVRFNYPEALETFSRLMTSDKPTWIGRLGGSDTDFVEYWAGTEFQDPRVDLLRRLNGYFDPSQDVNNLRLFRDMYIESSRNMDLCTVHMSSVFGEALNHSTKEMSVLKYKYGIPQIMCWRFIENCTYFLESFQTWGTGQKILVVSPFSKSIDFQTQPNRVSKLHLPQFAFPECTFVTLDSPITYNTDDWICEDSDKSKTWFDVANRMFERIKAEDFDVAWLSCGSYAMYLGHRIKRDLGKKAIYMGGMANVFFNIYNFRYSSTGHDRAVINPDMQIVSLENSKFHTDRNIKNFPYSEGIRAYFGKPST